MRVPISGGDGGARVILAHLSDPHLPPPPGRGAGEGALKARIARAAWRRKRHVHLPEVLAALLADIRAHRPDHVALTGDLVNVSAPAEIAAARDWLEALSPPHDLTLSPGNHDLMVDRGPDPWAAWRPWMEDAPGPFPHLRVRGDVALVNLCSAVPTPVFSARGRLGPGQLDRLEVMLRETGAAGLRRVLLVHHPAEPGAAPARKALDDAPALAAVLARAGAELVLHGHLHRAGLGRLRGPDGPIPVLGAPSASSSRGGGRLARWNLVHLPSAPGEAVGVFARGLLEDGTVGELGRWTLQPQRR